MINCNWLADVFSAQELAAVLRLAADPPARRYAGRILRTIENADEALVAESGDEVVRLLRTSGAIQCRGRFCYAGEHDEKLGIVADLLAAFDRKPAPGATDAGLVGSTRHAETEEPILG